MKASAGHGVDHYGAQYSNFASTLYAGIRREVFGEDIGQNGWITADEQDLFVSWLGLDASSRLLDVACGSGGPAMRIAQSTGCAVDGVDIHHDAVKAAKTEAARRGLDARVSFHHGDASEPLAFPDGHFDGVICIDALNHLKDRPRVFSEWARVLRPGGRVVFTNPIVVTGLLTNEEIAVRSSIGFFLYTPPGLDATLLGEAGLEVRAQADRTANMAAMAERWRAARQQHADVLAQVEGESTFAGQQEFLGVAALLAAERRLSRLAYLAVKPAG